MGRFPARSEVPGEAPATAPEADALPDSALQYLVFGLGSGNPTGLSAAESVMVSPDFHSRGLRLM